MNERKLLNLFEHDANECVRVCLCVWKGREKLQAKIENCFEPKIPFANRKIARQAMFGGCNGDVGE